MAPNNTPLTPLTPLNKPLTPLIPTTPQVEIPGQYQTWITQWEHDEEMLQAMRSEIFALLKKMEYAVAHHKDVSNMLIQFTDLYGDFKGQQVKGLADVDQLDTAIRNALTGAQNDFNGIAGDTKVGPNDTKEAEALVQFVAQLKAMLAHIQSTDPGMMDSAMAKNLTDTIGNLTTAFGTDWGDPNSMAIDIQKWVQQSNSGAGTPGGGYSPEFKEVTDALQTLNQTVSALSTSTNTSLQTLAEQIKQYLGVEESCIQSLLKFTLTTVNNQRVS